MEEVKNVFWYPNEKIIEKVVNICKNNNYKKILMRQLVLDE